MEDYARTLRELGQTDDEDSPKPFKSLVYTDDSHSRSPLMNLLLAIVILGILTACVLAGLHFYRRSLAPKTRSGTGQQNVPRKSSSENQIRHSVRLGPAMEIRMAKEGEHEFTV
jgi:hypothetical protein